MTCQECKAMGLKPKIKGIVTNEQKRDEKIQISSTLPSNYIVLKIYQFRAVENLSTKPQRF